MTLFQEIEWAEYKGGQIVSLETDGLGAEIGLEIGDELLAINNQKVMDVIDVQFHSSDEELELLIRRGEEYIIFEAARDYGETLGIEFAHPTFDIDIRRCNNLCEFCFVLQMAPKFRRTLYIKDDDYRYSFLFGHFVTLTNLDEHDWWRIEHMRLSPLYISVHVTDLTLRREFLRNKTAPDIMDQLRKLASWNIKMHTQLVVVPEFNDGAWLERSIAELSSLWPAVQSISVVPVGLTSHHKYKMRPHTAEEAGATLDYVNELQKIYQEKVGNRFVYPTDEWFIVSGRPIPEKDAYDGQSLEENGLGMVRRFLDEWKEVQEEIAEMHHLEKKYLFDQAFLVTGTLFGQTLTDCAKEFTELTNLSLTVFPAINLRLGDTITVAGLLMAEDVLTQLKEQEYGPLIILPRIMFDHPDTISLDNLTPQDVADKLQTTIALADTMGDVWDAFTGQSAVLFYPTPPAEKLLTLL